MITEAEYQALEAAYERLHVDYENLEQEMQVDFLKEQYQKLQEQYEEKDNKIQELCEQQQILDRYIWERNQRIDQLEGQLAEYYGCREQYTQNNKELIHQKESLQHRVEELEQWTGHLQSLCDERQERIEQLEYYIHHPIFSIVHLFQIWKNKWTEQKLCINWSASLSLYIMLKSIW